MNKHERTYAVIRARILDGAYAPGDRLVLDSIAKELGVSVVPVREALRKLEAEGWIVYRSNAGARVAPVDPEAWESVMHALAVLEGYATAAAAPHLGTDDLVALRENNRRAASALDEGDMVAFAALNREFHFGIYGTRCPNPYLVEVLIQTWDRLDAIRRTVFVAIPSRGWESVREHDEILDLIAAAAPPDEIESLARRHKLATIEAYRRAGRKPEYAPGKEEEAVVEP